MKLVSLSLSGYRQFLEHSTLDVPEGLTGICGPNGVGKSKLIEAIGYALYGARPQVMPSGDKAKDIPSSAGSKAVPEVKLVVDLKGQRYEITRSAHSRKTEIRLDGAADPLATSTTGVTKEVIGLLRLSPDAFVGTFVAKQNEVAGLLALPPAERKRLVNRLIGITQIEVALDAAKNLRSSRNDAWQRAQSEVQGSVREAEAEITRTAGILDGVRTAFAAAAEELRRAQNLHEQAGQEETAARRLFEEARRKADELEILGERHSDLERLVAETQNRLEEAVAAGQEIERARTVLRATEDAAGRVRRYEALRELAAIQRELDRLREHVERRLAPAVRERSSRDGAVRTAESALEGLSAARETVRQRLAVAKEDRDRAAREVGRIEKRESAARSLGARGACETCGQVFGDNFTEALRRLGEDLTEARRVEAQSISAFQRLTQEHAEIQERILVQEAQKEARQKALDELETLPGEVALAERQISKHEARLAAAPPEYRGLAFSEDALALAVDDVRRRDAASSEIGRLEPAASNAHAFGEDVAVLRRRLEESDVKINETQKAGERAEPLQQAAEAAAERLAEAGAALETVSVQERAAFQEAAGAQAAAAEAERRRDEVRIQERKAAQAKREADAAQRAETLLQQLLNEVVAEARPRLAQLMDGWARSLLGERFQRIELTADYRAQADNGSGLHDIEHFSGGEQTLLAVMLRVAISIFCQERAGFETGFLILDEVFGDQDGEHRAQLVQFLEEIKEHYHQILIVNHVEAVTDMLDSIIDVKRTGPNTSVARFRTAE